MSPSPSSPRPCLPPLTPPEPLPQDDGLEQLRSNGKIVVGVIGFWCVYGNLTVLRHMQADPRQDGWLLMWSPYPTIALSLLYVAAVTWWGPRYMSNRKPVTGLRPIMMAYNVCQVVFSAWLFWEAGMGGWFGSYSFLCERCDYSSNPMAIRMLHAGYWYLFSKFVDFIDTFFFVVNKKNDHLTLLHVCHHALMPVCMWYGIRHHAGGHTTLVILLNSWVHTVMYLYYLLAAMGPSLRPYLWWKKYLTAMQLIQFAAIIVQNFMVLVLVECSVPPVLLVWVSSISFLFFLLFTDFYIKAYRRRGKHQAGTAEGGRRLGLKAKVGGLTSYALSSPPDLDRLTQAIDMSYLVTIRSRTCR